MKGENSQFATGEGVEGDPRLPCIQMRELGPDTFHSESMLLLMNHDPV